MTTTRNSIQSNKIIIKLRDDAHSVEQDLVKIEAELRRNEIKPNKK